MKFLNAASVAIVITLGGCAAPAPYVMKTKFDTADLASYTYKGNATISGQAFLKTRGGDVRYGAGNDVFITPATAYTQEIVRWIDTNDNDITIYEAAPSGNDKVLATYIRKSTADGQGNFSFSGLTPGNYYIECGIFWDTGAKYSGKTGAVARKLVRVGAGEQQRIMLTQ